jgi:hypothetical protein
MVLRAADHRQGSGTGGVTSMVGPLPAAASTVKFWPAVADH